MSKKTIWVVALPEAGCYAGKQVKRFKSEVEIELLDAFMLSCFGLAGEGSLAGELKRFPVESCRFFNDIQSMATCVFKACERYNAQLNVGNKQEG